MLDAEHLTPDAMKKDEFQQRILEEIKRELGEGETPIEKVRELAAAALALGDKYPDEIPNDEANEMVMKFTEIAKETSAELKEKMKEDDDRKIDEIRGSLGVRK